MLRYGLVILAVCGLCAADAQAAVEYSVFNLSAEWDAEFPQPEIVQTWYANSINNVTVHSQALPHRWYCALGSFRDNVGHGRQGPENRAVGTTCC